MPSNDWKRTKIVSIPINDPKYVHLFQIMERSLERHQRQLEISVAKKRQRQLEISVATTLVQMHDMKPSVRKDGTTERKQES